MSAVRTSHAGLIRKHPSRDLWEARYTAADGRKRSIYGKTRREAQERLRAALMAADSGLRPTDNRLTVGAFLDDWLAGSVRTRCRPSTAENYEIIARRYLKPALGRLALAKLEPAHIERMLGSLMTEQRLSPTTVRYVYSVLRIALGRALKSGKVHRNVAILVDPPAKAKTELRPLSAAEVGAFLEHVEQDRLLAHYVTAIGLGLRQGELLGLRWSDVDLEAGLLTIRHTLQRGGRGLGEPKTERAKRTLRLGSEVLSALKDHRRRQLEERLAAGSAWRDGGYVFTTSIGTPLDHRNVVRSFQAALAAAGLPRQRFHDMRHAYATILIEQGEELGVVSKMLGHSTVATTADVYSHLKPAMSQRVADRMDSVLRVAR